MEEDLSRGNKATKVLVVVDPARSEIPTKISTGKKKPKKKGDDLCKCSVDKASTKPSSRLPSAIKLETERNLRTTTVRASNEMWKAITACATVPKGTLSLDHRKLENSKCRLGGALALSRKLPNMTYATNATCEIFHSAMAPGAIVAPRWRQGEDMLPN